MEALLSRIRAEARIHGYEIVLVGVRDGTAILMVTPSSAHPEGPGAVATTEPVAVSLDDHLHRVESDMNPVGASRRARQHLEGRGAASDEALHAPRPHDPVRPEAPGRTLTWPELRLIVRRTVFRSLELVG